MFSAMLTIVKQTYRLYVVWNRVWWILIVPSVLLLGTAGVYSEHVVMSELTCFNSRWLWRLR